MHILLNINNGVSGPYNEKKKLKHLVTAGSIEAEVGTEIKTLMSRARKERILIVTRHL